MLFWVIIFAIIFMLSFLLAARSMKNSSNKIKPLEIPQALLLIRKPDLIDQNLVENLHQLLLESDGSISFERLFKGEQQAMALYGPEDLPVKLPELELLELEDYLIPKGETLSTKNPNENKFNADQSFVWVVPVEGGMGKPSLNDLNLGDEEQFFYQIIIKPILKKEEKLFKVNVRAIAATKNKLDKIKLAKRLFTKLNESFGIESERLISSSQAFEKYHFRLPEGEKSLTISETTKILV